MKPLSRRQLLSLFPLLSATGPSRAAEDGVLILGSERGGAYQEAAEALMAELERGGLARAEMRHLALPELDTSAGPGRRLHIALGAEAAGALARREPRAPLLCALLPRAAFERVAREAGRRPTPQFSALYLGQPPERQLNLIRLALPQARRIGVLWSEESRALLASLENAARARELHLVAEPVRPGEPIFSTLKKVLDDADVLLALPDPNIYNSGSIQNILLTSFRARVPLAGYSASFVRAGALMAVQSTPAQIGRQAAHMARAVLQGRGGLPAPQEPQEFMVSVNEPVARALGLQLDATALTERLHRLEKGP